MTQSSYPQAGYYDAVARRDSGPYTATEWRAWMASSMRAGGAIVAGGLRTMAALADWGVFYAVPNRLEVTNPGAAANTLQIDTGACMCGGFYHYNDTAVTLTVPSNLTNQKIVVRNNFTGATYTPPASVDADEQVPPYTARISRVTALVQDVNLATYWDIPLADVTTDGAGAVTLVDEREYVDAEMKQFLVPLSVGWNSTDGSVLEVDASARGLAMPTDKLAYAYGFFSVPHDAILDVDIAITPIIITGAAPAANVRLSFDVLYSECAQQWNTHGGAGVGTATATHLVSVPGVRECITAIIVYMDFASMDDHVNIRLTRDGLHADDVYVNEIYAFGGLVEYFGWGRK